MCPSHGAGKANDLKDMIEPVVMTVGEAVDQCPTSNHNERSIAGLGATKQVIQSRPDHDVCLVSDPVTVPGNTG